MISKCLTDSTLELIKSYIGKDCISQPYLYANLYQYGICDDDVHCWALTDSNKMKGVFLQYYDCLHFYSRDIENYVDEVAAFIRKMNTKIIMIPESVGRIIEMQPQYKLEQNHVVTFSNSITINSNGPQLALATVEDIQEIVEMTIQDPIFHDVYTREVLEKQLRKRIEHALGRVFCIRLNGQIVAKEETYAENSDMAIVSGLLVHPKYRGNGFAPFLISHIAQLLKNEGKMPISFIRNDNIPSIRAHEKIGCSFGNVLYKYIRADF